ncbi:MAG: MerR family transcriptional regulator [Bacteroidetes Order II. Incertae sedis bacterium]|nr:MerR family transcriptional regulator [Bacteroidetes Order II. bacterium]
MNNFLYWSHQAKPSKGGTAVAKFLFQRLDSLATEGSIFLKNKNMTAISISQLSQIAGVSLRTLRHYDEIGLLKPSLRRASGYRYYGKAEVLRLQQILFYKELGLPLAKIHSVLDAPHFDLITALESHKAVLEFRQKRTTMLLETIQKTLLHLKQEQDTMKSEDLYKGFDPETAEAYEAEAKERWGAEAVEASKNRVMAAGKEQWEAIQADVEALNQALADAMATYDAQDEYVQKLVKRHFEMIGNFYTVTPKMYQGLASLYVDDPRFTAYYEKYRAGLAAYLSRAMQVYCSHHFGPTA